MGEAPPPTTCFAVQRHRPAGAGAGAAYSFRLPRHGRRKVHIVRLGGGGGGGAGGARGGGGGGGGRRRGFRLRRWLRRAVWRLAELCVAALSGHPGVQPTARPPPWTGVEPYFAAPFVPVAMNR